MNDKIKVVYAWIGPVGPIWNTELPNILNFTGVAESAGTTSHYWWTEENYRRLFSKSNNSFEVYPASSIEIDDDRPFIYPFTLIWRVEFEKYFLQGSGLFEFSHMPRHLIPLFSRKNGYILINLSIEAFMHDRQLQAMHSYFKANGIPLHKVIYVTGAMNANDIYENFCDRHNIPNTPAERLSIISYPSSIDIFNPNMTHPEQEPRYIPNYVPKNLFLMWNRRYRPQRIEMALHLEHLNVVDRSYISFPRQHVEQQNTLFETAYDKNYIQNVYPYITDDDINRFTNKLPLILDDETDINQMCGDPDNKSRPYYQSSLISIITETNYYENEVSLTEKSFKPLKEKHPFIIVGVPGAIKAMRELGFKTFSDFWDESYDECQNPNERMRKLFSTLSAIASWTDEEILEFRRKVRPILEYNYQLLKRSSCDVIVAEKIKNLINGQPE